MYLITRLLGNISPSREITLLILGKFNRQFILIRRKLQYLNFTI